MEQIGDINELDKYLKAQNGKIIHQIWFYLSFKSKLLFKKFQKYQKSWIIKNPSWRYILWNEKIALQFMKLKFPEFLDVYNSYPYDIQRIDALRYFLLYAYGGIYADMDTECIQPIDNFMVDFIKDIYFVEDKGLTIYGNVSNFFMFSKPHHPFWKSLFLHLFESRKIPSYYTKHLQILHSTGPGFLNKMRNKYLFRYNIGIFPNSLFNPFCANDGPIDREKVFVIHYSEGTWWGIDSALFNFIKINLPLILLLKFFILICILKLNVKK